MRRSSGLPVVLGVIAALAGAMGGCSRQRALSETVSGPTGATSTAPSSASSTPSATAFAAADDPPLPPSAKPRAPAGQGPTCTTFASPEDAFRWVLAFDPSILAVGEAHAQKGTEDVASSTKRFTEEFLPLLAGRASDVVVELWAPDPKCQKEVKAVASAQKPIGAAQADTNQNEYVTLGTRAKDKGMTPWLLRPTCDDFAMLADAGADAVGAMLGLVKRLTEAKLTQLHDRTPAKVVVAYGGAMHNDIRPSDDMKDYAFGPDMVRAVGRRYVELDLIVPEYVQDTSVWQKLPWFEAWKSRVGTGVDRDRATVYRLGERSFVLVFPYAK